MRLSTVGFTVTALFGFYIPVFSAPQMWMDWETDNRQNIDDCIHHRVADCGMHQVDCSEQAKKECTKQGGVQYAPPRRLLERRGEAAEETTAVFVASAANKTDTETNAAVEHNGAVRNTLQLRPPIPNHPPNHPPIPNDGNLYCPNWKYLKCWWKKFWRVEYRKDCRYYACGLLSYDELR